MNIQQDLLPESEQLAHARTAEAKVETPVHTGLLALCGVAAYYRISADASHLAKDLAIATPEETPRDIVRGAARIGLRARVIEHPTPQRLASAPVPALLRLKTGCYSVFAGKTPDGRWRIVDPVSHVAREVAMDELIAEIEPLLILVARRRFGAGIDPKTFGFHWFAPSLWRYRKPLIHVLIASFFVQLFAL
ncbi:ABC-type bacteriocin/lantibiotic exporter with double-glycine peptidase domain, partial [Rhodoblastus acidophilus]